MEAACLYCAICLTLNIKCSVHILPRMRLIVDREGLQGPVIFQAAFCVWCVKIFFALSLWLVNRYRPEKNCQYAAHFAVSLCAFYMLDSRWIRSHHFQTPNAAWKMTGPGNLPDPRSSVSVVPVEIGRECWQTF